MGFVKGISISDYISLVMELKSGSNLFHYILLILLIISFVVGFTVHALVGTGAVILTISVMDLYHIISIKQRLTLFCLH